MNSKPPQAYPCNLGFECLTSYYRNAKTIHSPPTWIIQVCHLYHIKCLDILYKLKLTLCICKHLQHQLILILKYCSNIYLGLLGCDKVLMWGLRKSSSVFKLNHNMIQIDMSVRWWSWAPTPPTMDDPQD